MAVYNGVEVTFLGNNKVRVTWENIGGGLAFSKKGSIAQSFPIADLEVISGRVNTAGGNGLVGLVNGGGEIVLTYSSAVNLTAIGYSSSASDFANWIRMSYASADAELIAKSQYIWVQATPLSTPTGLNAAQITSNSATISWTAVENASGYKVEYRQAAGGGQTYPWVEAQG